MLWAACQLSYKHFPLLEAMMQEATAKVAKFLKAELQLFVLFFG